MRTNLRKDEEKILEVKKHWFVLVKPLLLISFVLLSLFLLSFTISPFPNDTSFKIITLIMLMRVIMLLPVILAGAIYFIYKIFDRKFDIWVITNLRIIDESGVFSHNIKESSIDKINNVSFRQSLFGRVFDYGDIQIQTAAEMGATTFKFVSSPKLLKDTITTYQEEYRQTQIAEQAQKLSQAIKDEVGTKKCPFCAEMIKKDAIVCRYCGRDLPKESKVESDSIPPKYS